MAELTMDKLVALCKNRGFIFAGSEIYGGLGGTYDYGPYGVELMKNIKNAWWNAMIYSRNDIEGLDASLIGNRLMWKYSGHEGGFSDPLVECKKCGARMRQDKMRDQTKCDNCGSTDLMPPREYQLMMGLSIGAVADGEINAYLRPETATTTYINFKNVLDSVPHKLPFGIAQIFNSICVQHNSKHSTINTHRGFNYIWYKTGAGLGIAVCQFCDTVFVFQYFGMQFEFVLRFSM